MDKILLTRDDRLMLRDWYDKNTSLVAKYPCPLKNIKIEGILKDVSAKFFRDGNDLKIYIAEDGEKSFRADLIFDGSNGNIILKKHKIYKLQKESA